MFGLTYCCTLWLNYNHRKRQQFICVVDINLQILKYCRSGGEQSHYLHLVAVVMRDADNDWWARAYRQRDVWGELVFFSLAARNINLYNLYQKSSVWCFAFSHTSTFELIPQSRDRPVGSLGDRTHNAPPAGFGGCYVAGTVRRGGGKEKIKEEGREGNRHLLAHTDAYQRCFRMFQSCESDADLVSLALPFTFACEYRYQLA